MRVQHLSDEAIAAFADDVLTGNARERARRHTASCSECNDAVAEQRAAICALRAASEPSLPTGLLDRLRDVPATTPIRRVPPDIDERESSMFAAFAMPASAFVQTAAPTRAVRQRATARRGRPLAMTAAVAFVGVLTGSAVAADSAPAGSSTTVQPGNVQVRLVHSVNGRAVVAPADAPHERTAERSEGRP